MAGVSGLGLAYATAGGVLLWSGLKGQKVSDLVHSLLSGNANAPVTETVGAPAVSANYGKLSASDAGAVAAGAAGSFQAPAGQPAGTSTAGMAALQAAAKAHGWDKGSEWNALVYVEMREAGFSRLARNPKSGAFGMAQALGHGTAGSAAPDGTNEYGGFGLTDAQAKQANEGNAYWQAVWMCNYIKAQYGDPIAAAAHEKADNWY